MLFLWITQSALGFIVCSIFKLNKGYWTFPSYSFDQLVYDNVQSFEQKYVSLFECFPPVQLYEGLQAWRVWMKLLFTGLTFYFNCKDRILMALTSFWWIVEHTQLYKWIRHCLPCERDCEYVTQGYPITLRCFMSE